MIDVELHIQFQIEESSVEELLEIIQKQSGDALNKIRMNRNVVNSFKKRQVDGWDDLVYSLKFIVYCYQIHNQ